MNNSTNTNHMKMRFDTSAEEGKAAVMLQYTKDKRGLCVLPLKSEGIVAWSLWHLSKTCAPKWNWEENDYNYRSEPKLVPWTLETVPNKVPGGLWVRRKSTVNEHLVAGVYEHGISVNGRAASWRVLSDDYESTVDGGRTWLPCGTLEE